MPISIFVPVRLASSRFPNKPLERIRNKSLLQLTTEQAMRVPNSKVYVVYDQAATAIKEDAARFLPPSQILPTRPNLWCGSQRAAQAALDYGIASDEPSVVWQVDEPVVSPGDVEAMVADLVSWRWECSTLLAPLTVEAREDRNAVKAVVTGNHVRWFSRSYLDQFDKLHVGIYAFSSATFRDLYNVGQTRHAEHASLEQLAWIERGVRIMGHRIATAPMSINTPADWSAFKQMQVG